MKLNMSELVKLPSSEGDEQVKLPEQTTLHNSQVISRNGAGKAWRNSNLPSSDSTIDLLRPLMNFNEAHGSYRHNAKASAPKQYATVPDTDPSEASQYPEHGLHGMFNEGRLGLYHIPDMMKGENITQQPQTVDPRDLYQRPVPCSSTQATVSPQAQPHPQPQRSPCALQSPLGGHFLFSVTKAAHPYQVQLSRPAQLDDIDQIHESDRKEVGKCSDPDITGWLRDISKLFWERVMDLNQDILPPDDQLRSDVLSQLCRSHIFIHDLWTGHTLHRDLAVATGWNDQVPYNLHRLKHWMSEPRRTGNWAQTHGLKKTPFEILVPWIPRAQLLAFKILLRRGHPLHEWTVDVKGIPMRSDKATANRQMKASQKKLDLLRDCELLYLVNDASADPHPSKYWAGFDTALRAREISVWGEETPENFRAEDKAAKMAYQRRAHAEPSSNPVRQDSVHQAHFAPVSGFDDQPDVSSTGSEEIQLLDRVRHLEEKVRNLNEFVNFIAEHLSHQPSIVPWPLGKDGDRQ